VAVADPTLSVERSILKSGARYVIGCDEVGRGAIAGPVAVGLSVVEVGVRGIPAGLRDSKLLSEKRLADNPPPQRAVSRDGTSTADTHAAAASELLPSSWTRR